MSEIKDASVSIRLPNAQVEGAPIRVVREIGFATEELARVAESDAATLFATFAEPAYERPEATEAKTRLRDSLVYHEKTPRKNGEPQVYTAIRLADLRLILIAAGVELPEKPNA